MKTKFKVSVSWHRSNSLINFYLNQPSGNYRLVLYSKFHTDFKADLHQHHWGDTDNLLKVLTQAGHHKELKYARHFFIQDMKIADKLIAEHKLNNQKSK